MSEVDVIPELKQIIGALLFAAKEPVSIAHLIKIFGSTAEQYGGITADFKEVNEEKIREALEELKRDMDEHHIGIQVREVANGYRLVNDAGCGPWLRVLLDKGKSTRLSRPALETLAIVAYRQPVIRSEIEAVRGVAVDQILRNLLDMQLVRVLGRSELPGRPWQFGTSHKFLEHFGLKNLNELPGTEDLRRLEAEQLRKKDEGPDPENTEETPDAQADLFETQAEDPAEPEDDSAEPPEEWPEDEATPDQDGEPLDEDVETTEPPDGAEDRFDEDEDDEDEDEDDFDDDDEDERS